MKRLAIALLFLSGCVTVPPARCECVMSPPAEHPWLNPGPSWITSQPVPNFFTLDDAGRIVTDGGSWGSTYINVTSNTAQ